MVAIDTVEGTVGQTLWFHYDVGNDVLYLRQSDQLGTPTLSEETSEGFFLLRREDNDQAVGMTVISWWKIFGEGSLPDSLSKIAERVEAWARDHRIAA